MNRGTSVGGNTHQGGMHWAGTSQDNSAISMEPAHISTHDEDVGVAAGEEEVEGEEGGSCGSTTSDVTSERQLLGACRLSQDQEIKVQVKTRGRAWC